VRTLGEGVLQMRTSVPLGAKNVSFDGVSARTWESIFRDFVRTSFMDSPQGAVHKRRCSQVGVSSADTFRKLWYVRTDKGVEQCGHLANKGGVIFRDFVQTFFMNGPKLGCPRKL